MVQPSGESNPAGDSEHDTRMHIPHGTKEQEEEEEQLKWVPSRVAARLLGGHADQQSLCTLQAHDGQVNRSKAGVHSARRRKILCLRRSICCSRVFPVCAMYCAGRGAYTACYSDVYRVDTLRTREKVHRLRPRSNLLRNGLLGDLRGHPASRERSSCFLAMSFSSHPLTSRYSQQCGEP
jgi:hypothetical protein